MVFSSQFAHTEGDKTWPDQSQLRNVIPCNFLSWKFFNLSRCHCHVIQIKKHDFILARRVKCVKSTQKWNWIVTRTGVFCSKKIWEQEDVEQIAVMKKSYRWLLPSPGHYFIIIMMALLTDGTRNRNFKLVIKSELDNLAPKQQHHFQFDTK